VHFVAAALFNSWVYVPAIHVEVCVGNYYGARWGHGGTAEIVVTIELGIYGRVRVNIKLAQEIETVGSLQEELIPHFDFEVGVTKVQSCNDVVLACLDGAFCGIALVHA
jgi:hypothetical protein